MDDVEIDDVTLLEEALGISIPLSYTDFLRTRGSAYVCGRVVLGLPLSPSLESVWGATTFLWMVRPDLAHQVITIQLRDATALCIDLRHANRADPPVVELALDVQDTPHQVAESFSSFIAGDRTNADPLDRIAARLINTKIEERPDIIADELNLEFPPSLSATLASVPPAVLTDLVYCVDGLPSKPPHVLWALSTMRDGAQPPADDLIPIMAVDERSFACVVCRRRGTPRPASFGQVVRWHLDDVPVRAQRQLLDIDLDYYLDMATTELKTRDAGLERMRQIAERYEETHASVGRLPKAHEERPIRLAVQNVIVGLAAIRHDSAFDGLSVSAWQTCQAPHINVHEGCRGLAAMTLSEAFRSGGTMEIRFDRHPERSVPACLRQYARVHGIRLGASDPKAISPAEARTLFRAVTQMPDDLRERISQRVVAGQISPERACFVLQAGIWKDIELDFLLSTSQRANSILRGGAEPFNRPARQAELAVCRSAVMVGMFLARLRYAVPQAGTVTRVLEDERHLVQWQILEQEGAVLFNNVAAGPIPWQGQERTFDIREKQSLVAVPRPYITRADIMLASALGRQFHALAVTIQPAETLEIPLNDGDAPVARLVAPDGLTELDRTIDTRLLACRVGRA